MDLSISDIAIAGARDMLMLWAVGSMALRVIPDALTICDKIKLGRKVLNFIGEAPEWINYDKNLEESIESLKEMMTDLLCVEEDVCQELEILEFQSNKKRKREVEAWLKNVKRKNEEVSEVERVMGQTRAFSRFLFRAWLGSCVENKKKEVSILLDQKRAFEQQPVINSCHVGREKLLTSSLVGEVAVQRKSEMWGHLTSQGVTLLGVEGEKGMGKSTIMMNIYNRVLDEPSLFDCAFYVNVKEEKSVYQLQSAIGRELMLQDLELEDDEIRRAARIYRALALAKRFVLILDGLTSPFELHNVGIPLAKDGGKLVVVAESKRVCQRMLCKPVLRLDALPYEDARKLFIETLKLSSDLSPQIEEVAEEIVHRSRGVPRSIIEAAESLRNEDDIYNWRTRLS